MSVAKKAILRTKIEGVLIDLMVKTNVENVYVDDTTTLAAKLAQIVADIAALPTEEDVSSAINAAIGAIDGTVKAYVDSKTSGLASDEAVNQIQQSLSALTALVGTLPTGTAATTVVGYVTEAIASAAYDDSDIVNRITGAESKLTTLIGTDTGKSVRSIANEELTKQLIPENADESLNTLKEIADWIQQHPGDAAAMNSAIEALQSQMNGISAGTGTVKKYVDDAIEALKIGDYAKAAALTSLASRVTTVEESAHTHSNATVLNGITADKVAAWDSKGNIYYASTEPANLADGDLWFQLID